MSDDDSDGETEAAEAAQRLALPREQVLESAAYEFFSSSLLAPGLPRHVDSPGGIRAVLRSELMSTLDEHVRSLGPPHTLVLTGVEGCGKSTALAQLCERVETMERRWEERRRGGALDPSEAPPFILKHSFADPSFPRDVSHFLERACLALRRRFNIREPVPADPADLPEAFAAFLEHAALFRRVLVIVDAAESIAVSPYASFPAAAIAGLDPRDGHALPELNVLRGDGRDSTADSDAPPFDVADSSAHFAWIPNSPPLAVRFIVSGRDSFDSFDSSKGAPGMKGAPGGIVQGVLRAVGAASARVYPTPPLTTEETGAMLAMFSPRHPGSTPRDSHHRGKEISEVVNAVWPHGATPLWVRTAAGRICATVEETEHGAWVSTGAGAAVDEWGNAGEKDEWGNPVEAPARNDRNEAVDEVLECPRTVASAVHDMPGTARGLFWEALDAMETRHGEHAVAATCVAVSVARFGVTRDELRGALRCRFERERVRVRFRPGGAAKVNESLRKLDDGRLDAVVDDLAPWLAPWCAKEAWHAELETFEGDRLGASREESEARAARHERESRRRRTLSGPGGPTYKPDDWYAAELPMRFRDDAYRAAALERYAPPRSASLREEFHADLAAYFLDVAAGSGSRALRADTRRALRAGLWHAASGRDVNSVADVLGRRGVMACLSRPGSRSDVKAVVCGRGETPRELWGAWRDRMATWMSADGDDAFGDVAGAGLTIAGLLRWIGVPTLAAEIIDLVRLSVGPPRGRSPLSIALAVAHARLTLVGAGDVRFAESVAGRARAAADLRVAARDAARDPGARVDGDGDESSRGDEHGDESSRGDEHGDESSRGDDESPIPRPWLDALEPCGGFASAIAFPDSLYAEAVSAVAEIAVARADSIVHATRGDAATRTADDALRCVGLETDAWLRVIRERAPRAVVDALSDALSDTGPTRGGNVDDVGVVVPREDVYGDGVFGLVRSLRRQRGACVRFSRHVDAGVVAGRLISVLTAALGSNHPQCGTAKLDAAESAAASAESSRSSVPGYDEASAWARPAYDFAAAFYGSQSLPAARAAWCVAEALRRADGAAAARPMYAQALGATASVLGKTHGGVGAMLSETAELSRLERRLEEADALAREGLDIASGELAAARRGLDEADAAAARAMQRREVTIREHGVDYLPSELLVALDHGRELARVRSADAEAEYAERAKQVARVIHATGRLPDAESFLRRALFAGEKAFGPSNPSLAATLGALGRCALARRRPEEAEACFRHALGVDERAAMLAAETATSARAEWVVNDASVASSVRGFRHPRSAAHLVHIAAQHRSGGRASRAEVYFHAALEAIETCDGSLPLPLADGFEESVADDGAAPAPDPGSILNVLAMMYKDQGRMAEAAVRYERSIALGAAAMRAATRAGDRRAWRVAAAAVSLRLCNLGALRARQNRSGDAAACFHRAATFAKNNLGDAHPQTALCRAWLSSAGGEDAADAGVGKAAGVMLDAVVAGDFPQLARPFATAWGALAGEETAVKRALADKMVKDIEASKPFPMETSSGPASRPATARSRPATATASKPPQTALAQSLPIASAEVYRAQSLPPPPEVYRALDRYRQVDEAKRAWSAWAHDVERTGWGDTLADLFDGLEVDDCLASVVDDVAAMARTSLIEPRNIVPTSFMFVDGATKAFRAAAAARIKAGLAGRVGDGWAAHGDGGDGRILSDVLSAASRGEPIALPPPPPEQTPEQPLSGDRDGAKEGAAEHARRLAIERAELDAAASLPGHVRAKAEIEDLETAEERRRTNAEPLTNYALRELDRDDDDHVFEDYYRQKLGVRLMESEERAAWQKKVDEIESRRAMEIFDAQTDPAKLKKILARERDPHLPDLIADKIRNGLEDPGGRGHDFWVPGEFEKAAREQDDVRAMMKRAKEERDAIKRELLELEAESLSRAASRAQSRHQSRLATPAKTKHGDRGAREHRDRDGSRDRRDENDEERERRRRRKEAKRSKANSRAHSRRESTRTTPHKRPTSDPYASDDGERRHRRSHRSSKHVTPKKKSARASLKFGQRFEEEDRRAAAAKATADARDLAAQAAERFDRAHAAMVAASDAALEARIRAATASPMKPQPIYARPSSASRSVRDKLAAFRDRRNNRPASASGANPVESQRREDGLRRAKLYGDDDSVEVGSAFGADYQDIDDVAYDGENRFPLQTGSRGGSVRASMESLKPGVIPAGMTNIPVAVPLYRGDGRGGSIRASMESLPPRLAPSRRSTGLHVEKDFEFPRMLEEERASAGGGRARPASARIARGIEDLDGSAALHADLNNARRRNAYAAGAGAPLLERPFVSRSVNIPSGVSFAATGRPSTSGVGARGRGGENMDDEWYWKMKKRVEQRRKELFSAPAQK